MNYLQKHAGFFLHVKNCSSYTRKEICGSCCVRVVALPQHGFNAAAAPLFRHHSGSLKKWYGVALLYVGTLRSQSRERSGTKPSVLWLRSRTVAVTKLWYRSRPTLWLRSQNKRAVVLCIGGAGDSYLTQQRYLLVQQLPQISFRARDFSRFLTRKNNFFSTINHLKTAAYLITPKNNRK